MAEAASQTIKEDILTRFRERTNEAEYHDARARKRLPGGDTRNASYYTPYPAYMERGEGCYLYDCDGNEYVDFLNNYTSLIHGHAHPAVVRAAQAQMERGTVLCSPAVLTYQHAELLCDRVASMEMVRYCNSGTEATLFAIRAARAFTKKDIIIKMEGGYHGSHDLVEVSIVPDLEERELPAPHVEGAGISQSTLDHVLIAPFNDLNAVETLLKKHEGRVAAIILEPIIGSLGMIKPQPGYLQGLRELADRFGVLLVFDEVVTFRLSTGGFQAIEGVEPDLTALGKIIGGGFPVGAFGGRQDIMAPFDPNYSDRAERIGHSGTFNGNNVTMAAGIAALNNYDRKTVDHINALGDRLRDGFNRAFKEKGIKGQCTGLGSLNQVHWRDGDILAARDTVVGIMGSGDLQRLLHLELLNRGVFSAPRGMFVISTPMTEREVDSAIEAFGACLEVLKPYATDVAPQLITE
jgi:glutamate-1-semialdehyde 2,1-aminomutase